MEGMIVHENYTTVLGPYTRTCFVLSVTDNAYYGREIVMRDCVQVISLYKANDTYRAGAVINSIKYFNIA